MSPAAASMFMRFLRGLLLVVGLIALGFAAIVVAFLLALTQVGFAHDAPGGWSYPALCCSGLDCRQVPADAIVEGPQGYVIRATGEVIPMSSAKVRPSPDGEFHWCSVGGADDGRTICLFVPPRAY